jgi:hypothetical protein
MKFNGIYNWQGEIHNLWTNAPDRKIAHSNFLIQLSKILDTTRYKLNCYFQDKPNHQIEEARE